MSPITASEEAAKVATEDDMLSAAVYMYTVCDVEIVFGVVCLLLGLIKEWCEIGAIDKRHLIWLTGMINMISAMLTKYQQQYYFLPTIGFTLALCLSAVGVLLDMKSIIKRGSFRNTDLLSNKLLTLGMICSVCTAACCTIPKFVRCTILKSCEELCYTDVGNMLKNKNCYEPL